MKTKADLTAELLRQRYTADGLTLQQIADETGHSLKTVWKRMVGFGIPRRPGCAVWKGGVLVDKAGYTMIYRPDHQSANHAGYIREHRLVMEKKIGRPLLRQEVVHHKDDVKSNNHPDNLELFPNNTEHLRATLKGKRPKWTEDGQRRIQAGVDKIRLKDLPPDDVIVSLYRTKTADEIAAFFGCSEGPILARLRAAGVVRSNSQRMSHKWPEKARMLELLDEMPVTDVAQVLGRSFQGIYLWMKQNGIPTNRKKGKVGRYRLPRQKPTAHPHPESDAQA